jgi:flagellar motor switch protein FliG
MADKDDKKKDAKAPKDGKAGKGGKDTAVAKPAEAVAMSEALQEELAALNGTQRAAVLVLLLGEQQASDIIRYMNPKEVQALGGAMVALSDLSQEVVNAVLDDFVSTLKKTNQFGFGYQRVC